MLSHYAAVCEFVLKSRFATASQVHRRFADGGHLASPRTARYQMQRLVDLGLLAPVVVRGWRPGDAKTYVTTQQGIALIARTYADHGYHWAPEPEEEARQRGRAWESWEHEISLTHLDLGVLAAAKARADLTLLHYERRYFRPGRALTYEHAGERHVLRPDAGYILRWGNRLLVLLMELDRGTMSLPRIRDKLIRYQRWLDGERERYLADLSQRYGTGEKGLIRIGFVVQNARAISSEGEWHRLASIMGEVLTLPSTLRDRLWLATWRDLAAEGATVSSRLANPIWYRTRDVRRATTQPSAGFGPLKLRNADQALGQCRHPLFPE